MQSLPAKIDTRELVGYGNEAVSFMDEHFRRLRELPAHGNRILHYDQLLTALLLSFFNPAVRSLRLIEHCEDFNGRIDLDQLAKSTTADALRVFDPAHLVPIIDDLKARVGTPKENESLVGITQKIVASDGTYLNTLADVAWALHQTRRNGTKHGQVRFNFQVRIDTWTPEAVSVSGNDGSEPQAFARDLLSDVLYVLDRNFVDFAFLLQLLDKNNNFVLRVRANAPAVRVVADRPLTPQDAEAGVVSDQTVVLTGGGAPAGEFRLVVIQTTNRDGKTETIRLLTSLTGTEVSARIVGEVYRQRWQIELFFKWLKTWANVKNLLSTSRNGITLQFYAAVIAVLLMHLQLGRRVSRYAILSLQLLMHGQITFGQMMKTLAKREREKALARERAAARRAAKKIG